MFARVNTAVCGASLCEGGEGARGVREKLFNQIKTSLPRAYIVTAISSPEQNRKLYAKFYTDLFIMATLPIYDLAGGGSWTEWNNLMMSLDLRGSGWLLSLRERNLEIFRNTNLIYAKISSANVIKG